MLKIITLEERIVLDAAAAAVIYVDAHNTSATHNGTSWANAYTDLQSAFNKASITAGPDQIWVARGTYSPGNTATSTYTVPDQVSIYGGFRGKETNFASRNISANLTVLDGQGVNSTIVTINNAAVTIDGLTIQNAHNVVSSGGGISSMNGSNLTVSKDTFINNQVLGTSVLFEFAGGAIYSRDSDLTVINSTFRNNTALIGGAIGVLGNTYDYHANIISSTFTGNQTIASPNPNAEYQSGGAIASSGSIDADVFNPARLGHLNVNNSFFSNNLARGDGGGAISARRNFSIEIDNTIFDGNIGFHGGGAIHTLGNDSFIVKNSLFTNNSSTDDPPYGGGAGGAISDALDTYVLISGNIFHSNSADFGGGALDLEPFDTLVIIDKNIFIDNSAGLLGGAIFTDANTEMRVTNNLFTQNEASQQGGAIWDEDTTTVTIKGNVFGNDHAPANSGEEIWLARQATVNGQTTHAAIINSLHNLNNSLKDDDITIS